MCLCFASLNNACVFVCVVWMFLVCCCCFVCLLPAGVRFCLLSCFAVVAYFCFAVCVFCLRVNVLCVCVLSCVFVVCLCAVLFDLHVFCV